jgi:hypothetical protein
VPDGVTASSTPFSCGPGVPSGKCCSNESTSDHDSRSRENSRRALSSFASTVSELSPDRTVSFGRSDDGSIAMSPTNCGAGA